MINLTDRAKRAVMDLMAEHVGGCTLEAEGADVVLKFVDATYVIDEMGRRDEPRRSSASVRADADEEADAERRYFDRIENADEIRGFHD